jgi:hypothetical protein
MIFSQVKRRNRTRRSRSSSMRSLSSNTIRPIQHGWHVIRPSLVTSSQTVLGYLFSSLTHETLMHVSRSTSPAQAWCMLVNLYASQSHVHTINTWIALMTTKKLHLLVIDYYSKMCQYVDDLATTGAPLRDDELVTYILVGLDEDYNMVFTTVVTRIDPLSPCELYSQLSFEQHVSLQVHQMSGSSSSAMTTTHGHGSSSGRGYGGSGRGRGRGCSHGCSSHGQSSGRSSL